MDSAAEYITGRVRERVRSGNDALGVAGGRTGGGAHDAHGAVGRIVIDEVRRYNERAMSGSGPLVADEAGLASEVLASVAGFGALQGYLDDPSIEEIWINEPTRVFVARGGIPELTETVLTETAVRDLVERMLQSTGRRVDLSSPFVDASLPDGSRLHVAIPDVTRRHVSVNIRKFSARVRDLGHLVAAGSLSYDAADFLRPSVLAGANILVSGATQAGKTTLLNALIASAPPAARIVTVEETFELAPPNRDVVALQCRQPSLEGTGEITLRRLIKEALRMRPDRIVVGEVREAESLDLLIALNSGLPGMCSIHANTGRDALTKLCTLPLLAGRNIDSAFVLPTVASCIDLVVHCELASTGRRQIVEVLAVSGTTTGTLIETSTLFERRDGELVATGRHPIRDDKYRAVGIDLAALLGWAAR
ncbi:CpaF family protein [Plantibacter sp. Mn2098]|uniref:CpaF family protein n=1 Tax=Plantibacter sp. Mn2098 TaxID=3395266 RepID=UPI003BDA3010